MVSSIDLDGPDGNAFFIMGVAKQLCKIKNFDPDPIINRMQSGDYENLLNVFEKEFPEIPLVNRH